MPLQVFGLTLSEVADLAQAAAVLGGGGWALWTFQKLQAARTAEVDLRKGLAEIEKVRAEREEVRQRGLAQQPLLEIDLSVAHEAHDSDPHQVVLNVVVAVANKGGENLSVAFDQSTLTAGRITSKTSAAVQVEDVRTASAIYIDAEGKTMCFEDRIFRVGQKRHMVFAVPVRKAPTLFVQFRASYYRIPFERETKKQREGLVIDAIEQAFYQLHERGPTSGSKNAPVNPLDEPQ